MLIYFLPGMGATSAMYDDTWRSLRKARFLDWPVIDGEITLSSVAESLIATHNISSQDQVGGSSLGGIVALEIAKILGNEQVFLIGSALSIVDINPVLLMLAPLSDITPWKLIQVFAGKSSGELNKMFSQVDTRFIRKTCKAITQWEGAVELSDKVHRIHGGNDLVIKCPDDCEVIPNAGHLIAMTHSRECVDVIAGLYQTTG